MEQQSPFVNAKALFALIANNAHETQEEQSYEQQRDIKIRSNLQHSCTDISLTNRNRDKNNSHHNHSNSNGNKGGTKY